MDRRSNQRIFEHQGRLCYWKTFDLVSYTEYLVTDQLKNAAAVSTAVNANEFWAIHFLIPSVKFWFWIPQFDRRTKKLYGQ